MFNNFQGFGFIVKSVKFNNKTVWTRISTYPWCKNLLPLTQITHLYMYIQARWKNFISDEEGESNEFERLFLFVARRSNPLFFTISSPYIRKIRISQ